MAQDPIKEMLETVDKLSDTDAEKLLGLLLARPDAQEQMKAVGLDPRNLGGSSAKARKKDPVKKGLNKLNQYPQMKPLN